MFSKKYSWFLECSLIVLFLIVGFVPYFKAIDKIAPQFVYLAALNIISSFYILFSSKKVSFNYASYPIISLFVLSLWSFCSLIYAVNKAEVLIETSRVIIYLFTMVNIYLLVNKNKKLLKYIPFVISSILIIEMIMVLDIFYKLYDAQNFSRTNSLRAFSGNINITAFNFLLKFPFLIIAVFKIRIHSVFKILILATFTFCLLLIGSRGANLTLGLIIVIGIVASFILKEKNFILKRQLPILLISLIFGGVINYFTFQNSQGINVISRTTSFDDSSTQQRLRFYKAALTSIIESPITGVGIGNWKIYSTKYDKPFMSDYSVPYHAHNDFLEITAELGIIGFILFFGIFFYISYLIFNSIKSKEYLTNDLFYIITACCISLIVYLADSFLNFPFTRPLIQVQNIFYLTLILVIIGNKIFLKNPLSLKLNQKTLFKKGLLFLLIISGLSFSSYISIRVYNSFVNQQFLLAAGAGNVPDYSKEYIESIDSQLPSITATTIPIETLKAGLVMNITDLKISSEDTLQYMIDQGRKQNPFFPFNEFTNSILYVRKLNPDSAYVYAKKAFYELPNHTSHFDLLMDIAEVFKDSLEVEKAMNYLKGDLRPFFYERYLQASNNIKSNLGLTEEKFLEIYNNKNPDNDKAKAYNAIFQVGLKNVEDGFMESLDAEKYFKNKEFEKAAKSFTKAYGFNPTEVSYYENAANAYMQLGEDETASQILKEVISKLNPKTGKAEYLLAIIYLGQENYVFGCEYLTKSKQKGFGIPDIMFKKFCKSENKEQNKSSE
jgi:O-antigen ligase/tetratricopeptide (TPR) repeat protein